MMNYYDFVKIRLGLTDKYIAKKIVYSVAYHVGDYILGLIAMDDPAYHLYSGNVPAFGDLIRYKLFNAHKEYNYER